MTQGIYLNVSRRNDDLAEMIEEYLEKFNLSKADTEVIQRQMGHLPKGKVLKAYVTSLLLDERRTFLEDWCDALTDQGLKI